MVKEIKQVIVIRTDLEMGKGKMISQACHASLEAYKLAPPYFKNKWKFFGYKKVVLKVSSLEELLKIYEEAKKEKIPCVLIKDAGKTQLESGTITCVALGPYYSEKIDKITKNLKLL
ncbi:MAG: peptidyl-tRNA hydrolase Pth2 [Candidatus Aenigmatarchaeota archaeon]|nr:peptidyl-tRNA hydrolase Pth2 [Candidatus Aenigmarchaeota archaeon]